MNKIKYFLLLTLLNLNSSLYPMFGALKIYFWPEHALEELIEAIEKDDLDSTKKIINSGVDAKSKDKYGNPLLMIACGKNYYSYTSKKNGFAIIKLLIQSGAKIDSKSLNGKTILKNIIEEFPKNYTYNINNGKKLLSFLIEELNINVDTKNSNSCTLLEEIMNEMIKNNDTNFNQARKEIILFLVAKNSNTQNAINFAKSNNLKNVVTLIEKAEIDNSNFFKKIATIHNPKNYLLKNALLLTAKDKNDFNNNILHKAFLKHNLELIVLIIKSGSGLLNYLLTKENSKGETPLSCNLNEINFGVISIILLNFGPIKSKNTDIKKLKTLSSNFKESVEVLELNKEF